MLELKGVSAGYRGVPVLHDVQFRVETGERVALLGRNGMGKTTLMRALMGLLPGTRGDVLLDGASLRRLPPFKRARRGFGYVPQGRGLFPALSVAENLHLGGEAAKRDARAIPDYVFDYFPVLRDRSSQVAGTLSGGEQQQLAIARALVGQPKVLLLDEPSEGIQPNLVQRIGDELCRISRDQQLTMLLVEQNLDLAVRFAERCLVMEKGRVMQEFGPERLLDEAFMATVLGV